MINNHNVKESWFLLLPYLANFVFRLNKRGLDDNTFAISNITALKNKDSTIHKINFSRNFCPIKLWENLRDICDGVSI